MTTADCLSDVTPSTCCSPSFPIVVAGSSGILERKRIHIRKARAPPQMSERQCDQRAHSSCQGEHAQSNPLTDQYFPSSSSLLRVGPLCSVLSSNCPAPCWRPQAPRL